MERLTESERVMRGAARAVDEAIPAAKADRARLRAVVRRYVEREGLVGPLSDKQLWGHVERLVGAGQVADRYRKFAAVMVNNEVWRPVLAKVPFERRLLLLPQCLRDAKRCQGRIDQYGLLCAGCGSCIIERLVGEAQRLGYAVLVAEGSPVVMALLESGQVEAVVGVSCLAVLEKVFCYMEAAAAPGLAIPLLQDGCMDTSLDVDWLREALHLSEAGQDRLGDLVGLYGQVQEWFEPAGLAEVLGPGGSETEEMARVWLGKAGKRWRPFLAACVYATARAGQLSREERDGGSNEAGGGTLQKLAVAVECFHKASLIHDDIEDEDRERYGEPTLHEEHGVAVALNVGDFLLGEGYRLIGELEVASAARVAMLQVAATGHRTLCAGQGAELCWRRDRRALSVAEVVEIFRLKTAPAFEVALRLGGILAGVDALTLGVLGRYSEALGVAYQIQDDVADGRGTGEAAWAELADRPTLLPAIAYERADAGGREQLEQAWRGELNQTEGAAILQGAIGRTGALAEAQRLLDRYKDEAVGALASVHEAALKMVLRRVVTKVFEDVEAMGCCDEYQAGDGDSSGPIADTAG